MIQYNIRFDIVECSGYIYKYSKRIFLFFFFKCFAIYLLNLLPLDTYPKGEDSINSNREAILEGLMVS